MVHLDGFVGKFTACPSNFHLLSDDDQSCYSLQLKMMSWSYASLYCAFLQPGAHLAFINSEDEQTNILRLTAAFHEHVPAFPGYNQNQY